ncbi:MAG: iron-containing alcohol dehydrogenase family protein [Oscillospiraceae bacterium]
MNSFTFSVPEDVIFGVGSLSKLSDILDRCGSGSTFVISDHGLEKLGIVERVISVCNEKHLSVVSFLDVEPNPSVETVNSALACYKACGATSIVALGGGSPMDVAKAVAVLAVHGGEITDYEGLGRVPGDVVPLIAIPTTAGTGSEVTANAVITDHRRDWKFAIISPKIIPKYAILDSLLIRSLPPFIAASTGVDAFIHAMEAYLSQGASPFTDAVAEKGMELIGANIRAFVACRANADAADAMLVGSMFAGMAFAWARLGDIHAMSHPVSAYYNVPHGVANSVLMPAVLEYNELADTGRYQKIHGFLKKDKGPFAPPYGPGALVSEARQLLTDLGIPGSLSDVREIVQAGGISEETLDRMCADTLKSGNVLANPRTAAFDDIKAIYRRAMERL